MLFRKKQQLKINEKPKSETLGKSKIKKQSLSKLFTIFKNALVKTGSLLKFIPKLFRSLMYIGGIFRNTRIQLRLIVALLLISFIPLTITAYFSYDKSSKAIVGKTEVSASEIMSLTKNNIQLEINKYQNIYNELLNNNTIQKFLATDAEKDIENSVEFITRKDKDIPYVIGINDSLTERKPSFKASGSILSNKFTSENQINGAIFLTKKGYIINGSYASVNGKEMRFINELKKHVDNAPGLVWFYLTNPGTSDSFLVEGRKVKSLLPETEGQDVGYFFILLQQVMLPEIIQDINLGKDANIYVMTSAGQVLASTNSDKVTRGTIYKDKKLLKGIADYDGKLQAQQTDDSSVKSVFAFPANLASGKALVSYSYYNDVDWYVIGTIPYRYLQSESAAVGLFILLIALICLVVAVILSALIALSISLPLKKMVTAMKQAKDGDLAINIKDKGRDEIGEVIVSLNEMVRNIKNLITKVSISAKKVLANSDEIKILSERSYASSEQISLTIQEIAKGASEQAAEVAQGVNYMNNLSDGINKVGNEMSNVSDVVANTRKLSQDALIAVKSLNDKAVETNNVSEKIVNDINELNNDMKEIKKIVKLIAGIADQTNLLSINAAIEAARAGEAGKGFAVVADEVKRLADQSKLSSKTINDIIARIQKKTEQTASVAGNASEIVKQQMDAVIKTDKAFNTIVEAMEGISKQMENSAASVQEMVTSKESTLSSIDNISAVSQESAATAEEVSASTQEQMAGAEELSNFAKELKQMAQELTDAISSFKVEN